MRLSNFTLALMLVGAVLTIALAIALALALPLPEVEPVPHSAAVPPAQETSTG